MPRPTSNPQRPHDRVENANLRAGQETASEPGAPTVDTHTPKDVDVRELKPSRPGEWERLSVENEPVASSTNLSQQPQDGPDTADSSRLRAENSELRGIIAELRGLLE